jgi:hypothetical protein
MAGFNSRFRTITIGSVQVDEFSTDGTMSGNSDTALPTEKAIKTYVDARAGSIDAMIYKGTINASTQPNYPAADAGHFYIISAAGKVGGSSGTVVEAGDAIICNTDATTTGNEAAKGEYWEVMQTNIADPTAYATLASPTFTGTPTLPTGTIATTQAADNNTTAIATTAFYCGQIGTASPAMDGVAAAGTSKKFSPIDHVHPTDTSREPVPTTGTAAPDTTPSAIGLIFIDTVGKKAYMSMGTGASSDWVILN